MITDHHPHPATLCCLVIAAAASFLHTASAIPLNEFYPFGELYGDSIIGRTLDGSSPILTLRRPFPFFGRINYDIAVNNNGHISFNLAVSAWDPVPFPLNNADQLIAPFWADADTRPAGAGTVWYREVRQSLEGSVFERAQKEIRAAFGGQADRFTPRLVFIATWDHIGYHERHFDKTNTFQCILVSDGFMSFAIFLYADGLIQWTTSDDSGGIGGLGGNHSSIGVNAGDGSTSITHDYSFTDDVLDIALSRVPEQGVDRDGMLVYRVDSVASTNCQDNGEVILTPSFGNQLGGTPLLIRGPCFAPDDGIACAFDGIASRGKYVNNATALCVTPTVNAVGSVEVNVRIIRRASMNPNISSTTFTYVSSPRAHQVGFSVEASSEEMQLYLKPGDMVKLTWLPREVVPSYLFTDPDSIKINIQLFQVTGQTDPKWVEVDGTEMRNLNNSGEVMFPVPENVAIKNCLDQAMLCPVAFKVSATNKTTARVFGRDELEVTLERLLSTGIWTSVAFLQAAGPTGATGNDESAMELTEICESWSNEPQNSISDSDLSVLPACPPMLAQARTDFRYRLEVLNSGLSGHVTGYADDARRFYHPMASVCYVQVVMSESPSQQCCYDDAGFLVAGQPAGGSVDSRAPATQYSQHILDDLLPYAICCRGGLNCSAYDELRPSINMMSPPYQLPIPACVYGDPHVVTLDGLKYTFNGKGEFTLVATHDDAFTLQGRMVEATVAAGGGNNSAGGNDSAVEAVGTVFSAIVARQLVVGVVGVADRRVEFQVDPDGGLDVLVDGDTLNFAESGIAEHDFQQVIVTDLGNNSAKAEFSGGSNIEIRVENGIISVMLVTVATPYRSLTRGLMGNYNGNPDDDLVPKDSPFSISVDSTPEEIFQFGNTWEISVNESFFAYNRPGESFDAFQDTSFIPAFEPDFEDKELEQRAKEVCGEDKSCLFDVAATKNVDIGMSTMMGVQDFADIVELAEPIVCDPPCENAGVCVATNNCSCSVGFSGETCTERIVRECDANMCQNNATCVQYVASFTCTCPEGFIGIFCQEREPPFSLRLINSSPRTSRGDISAEFTPSKRLRSAQCLILDTLSSNRDTVDCTSGRVRFQNVSSGLHRLRIVAIARTRERVVERRTVFVCDEEEASCGVNLINEGMTVEGDRATIQFTSCGMVDSFMCRLNRDPFRPCRSPLRYRNLELRRHRLQVLPVGKQCTERKRLSANFEVI